jgi:hypothetical protein
MGGQPSSDRAFAHFPLLSNGHPSAHPAILCGSQGMNNKPSASAGFPRDEAA